MAWATFRNGRLAASRPVRTFPGQRLVAEATKFDPARHRHHPGACAIATIPRGSGDMDTGHRCPGEPLTQALLTRTVAFLREPDPTLPDQDLRLPENRFPPRPRDGRRCVVPCLKTVRHRVVRREQRRRH